MPGPLTSRHARRGSAGPDRRRQPGGPDDGHAARSPRGAVVVGGAPCRHRDPSAGRPLSAADDGAAAAARARGSRAREVAGDVQRDGRHRRRRDACRARAGDVRQGAQRGCRGVQSDGARLHQSGRSRAAAARARARARGEGAQPDGGDHSRTGRRRRDGQAPGPRLWGRERRPSALRRGGGRQPEPDARAAGNRYARLRAALAEHHHLLPRRLRRAAAGSQSGRLLRAQPQAARLLPARPDRRHRLPLYQHGRRRRHAGLGGGRAGGLGRGASAGVPAHGDRDDMPMELVDIAPWQAEANCAERLQAGRVFLAGDAAHVVPPMAALAATPASWTRTISHGSSRRSSTATRGRACSTPTRPSACRSAS